MPQQALDLTSATPGLCPGACRESGAGRGAGGCSQQDEGVEDCRVHGLLPEGRVAGADGVEARHEVLHVVLAQPLL